MELKFQFIYRVQAPPECHFGKGTKQQGKNQHWPTLEVCVERGEGEKEEERERETQALRKHVGGFRGHRWTIGQLDKLWRSAQMEFAVASIIVA